MFLVTMAISLFFGGWIAQSLVTGKPASKKEKAVVSTVFIISTLATFILVAI